MITSLPDIDSIKPFNQNMFNLNPGAEVFMPNDLRERIVHKLMRLFEEKTCKRTRYGFYKTNLCTQHDNGKCTFGESCHFAHGLEELHPRPILDFLFKIEQCDCQGKEIYSNFLENCAYGYKCHYRHDEIVYKVSNDPELRVYYSTEENHYWISYRPDASSPVLFVYSIVVPLTFDKRWKELQWYLEKVQELYTSSHPNRQRLMNKQGKWYDTYRMGYVEEGFKATKTPSTRVC